MTAEVAILNKVAIALAADSAVSIGENADKIFATNKLFALSKYHPVGIMIYNNAQFLGMPLETIVKEYRRTLVDASQPELTNYGDAFVTHLSSAALCPEGQVKRHIASVFDEYFKEIRDEVTKDLFDLVSKKGKYSTRDSGKIIDAVLSRRLTSLSAREILPSLAALNTRTAIKLYEEQYQAAKKRNFDGAAINKKADTVLRKIAGELLLRHVSGLYSGIVVAGFGASELFPSLVCYIIDGVVDGKLKFVQATVAKIGPQNEAIIVPFAEHEMADRFMDGIDRDYNGYLEKAIKRLVENLSYSIIDTHGAGTDAEKTELKKKYKETLDTTLDDFSKRAARHRQQQYVKPVIDTIIGMPKHELANMAEALVNLQSIKQRVSWEKETVGGPIDVAVISKGDGFIWIKRKHYFDPALNPHFAKNYFRH